MSEHPPLSPSGPSADGATAASVTVRLTDSTARGDPTVCALHEVDARVGFPSVAAAYAFEDRLNGAADGHEYLLTPDHQSDATFFLRCQVAEE